jgi:hypothetical protein
LYLANRSSAVEIEDAQLSDKDSIRETNHLSEEEDEISFKSDIFLTSFSHCYLSLML